MAERIAVVEDEQNIRDNVAFALEREGYRVDTYSDGLAAWEAFQQELPELLILDIIMPRMDGLELCRKIRAVSENVPVDSQAMMPTWANSENFLPTPVRCSSLAKQTVLQAR